MKTIDIDLLRKIITYNPSTGDFYRKNGDLAGYAQEPGRYRRVRVKNITFYEHRLAYAYMTGEWPENIATAEEAHAAYAAKAIELFGEYARAA